MANARIFEMLKALSAGDKKEFPKFLKSPYFLEGSNAEGIIRLYNWANDAAGCKEETLPDRPTLHALVFPGKAYSAVRLENALAKLAQLMEQFLAVKNYLREQNGGQREIDLLGIYREKRLVPLYEKKLRKIKKTVAAALRESSENYFFKYQLMCEEYEWLSTFNRAKGDLAVPELIEKLDLFYLTKRVELLNAFLLQRIAGAPNHTFPHWLLSGEPQPPQHYEPKFPVLLIQRRINELLLLEKPSTEGFEDLLDLLKQHEPVIHQETHKMFSAYLRNFCTFLCNSDSPAFINLLHRMHQDHLERGYLHHHGQIPPFALLNVTAIALKAGNLEWAAHFVEENRYKILADGHADDLYGVNKAMCLFHEKKFEEALQYLSFPTVYAIYYLYARRLEVKVYYETRSELFTYKLDAFRKYLERTAPHDLSEEHRVSNLGFVKILHQISQSAFSSPQRSRRLLERINQKTYLADRRWLWEKAEELAGPAP